MQHERMTRRLRALAARVRHAATRSTAAACARASCSCTPARSTAASSSPPRSIDSPQALIGQQVAAGVVVRMAVLYELLAGRAPAPDRAATPDGGSPAHERAPLVQRAAAGRPARPRRPRARPARGHRRAARRARARRRIAELGAPGALEAPEGAEVLDGEGRHLFPGFVDPHVHLRTPGQEHKEDLDTGTRAAAAGGFVAIVAMPNTDPTVDAAPVLRSLREAARREARVPVGFLAAITRGLRRRGADRDGRAAPTRARSASPTTAGRSPRRDAAPGAPVPAARRRRPVPARGGPVAVGPRASCTRATSRARLGLAGIPSISESTLSRATPRSPATRTAASTSSTSARASRSRRSPRPRRAGARITGEASPHHLTLTDEAVLERLDTRAEDEPAAARRGATARR